MAEATIIDGKAFAAGLRDRVAAEVARLGAEHGLTPGLAVVLVGMLLAPAMFIAWWLNRSDAPRIPARAIAAFALSALAPLGVWIGYQAATETPVRISGGAKIRLSSQTVPRSRSSM